jgi:hypothetical protein
MIQVAVRVSHSGSSHHDTQLQGHVDRCECLSKLFFRNMFWGRRWKIGLGLVKVCSKKPPGFPKFGTSLRNVTIVLLKSLPFVNMTTTTRTKRPFQHRIPRHGGDYTTTSNDVQCNNAIQLAAPGSTSAVIPKPWSTIPTPEPPHNRNSPSRSVPSTLHSL